MKKIFIIVGLVFTTLNACKPTGTASKVSGYVIQSNNRWPDPQNIPICYSNPEEATPEIRGWVKSSVEAQYNMRTNVRFIRFTDCTEADYLTNKTIRLHLKTVVGGPAGLSVFGPTTGTLGTPEQNGRGSLMVNINSLKFGSKYLTRDVLITDFKHNLIHELGHSLGLLHEHERSDAITPENCGGAQAADGVNGVGGIFIGKFDTNSIMKYCGDRNNFALSQGDIAAVNWNYPRPYTGPIPKGSYIIKNVMSERCIGANGAMVECVNAPKFVLSYNGDASYSLKNMQSQKCINGASILVGKQIVEEDCDKTPVQGIYLSYGPKKALRIQGTFLPPTSTATESCLGATLNLANQIYSTAAESCTSLQAQWKFIGTVE